MITFYNSLTSHRTVDLTFSRYILQLTYQYILLEIIFIVNFGLLLEVYHPHHYLVIFCVKIKVEIFTGCYRNLELLLSFLNYKGYVQLVNNNISRYKLNDFCFSVWLRTYCNESSNFNLISVMFIVCWIIQELMMIVMK